MSKRCFSKREISILSCASGIWRRDRQCPFDFHAFLPLHSGWVRLWFVCGVVQTRGDLAEFPQEGARAAKRRPLARQKCGHNPQGCADSRGRWAWNWWCVDRQWALIRSIFTWCGLEALVCASAQRRLRMFSVKAESGLEGLERGSFVVLPGRGKHRSSQSKGRWIVATTRMSDTFASRLACHSWLWVVTTWRGGGGQRAAAGWGANYTRLEPLDTNKKLEPSKSWATRKIWQSCWLILIDLSENSETYIKWCLRTQKQAGITLDFRGYESLVAQKGLGHNTPHLYNVALFFLTFMNVFVFLASIVPIYN